MYKLDLERAETPEIKLPTSVASLKEQENFRKTSISASLTTLKPLKVWITTNWKILKETGHTRPPYLPPEKSVCRSGSNRTRHGTTDWFQIGKGGCQGCILSPGFFNFYIESIIQNAGLDEVQAGINIAGRHVNNLRYADDTTPP